LKAKQRSTARIHFLVVARGIVDIAAHCGKKRDSSRSEEFFWSLVLRSEIMRYCSPSVFEVREKKAERVFYFHQKPGVEHSERSSGSKSLIVCMKLGVTAVVQVRYRQRKIMALLTSGSMHQTHAQRTKLNRLHMSFASDHSSE
jgi:hypothetical protein